MTKLSKKLLALVMAMAMVITMLPLNAIIALADSNTVTPGNGVAYEYLTGSTLKNATGTATWDSTKNAWSFNGSQYVKIEGAPLSGITASDGYAVSFEVYNPDNSTANKYFNFFNGSSRITMDGGSGDWWTRYRTEISDGTSTRGYYTSDLNSSSYCDPVASANGNDSYPTNQWYTMTVAMNPDGSYSYYRNGDLLGTYVSNYISTGNGGGLTDANAAAAVSGATDYIIGASNASGTDGFTGYMRNFKIIKGVTNNSTGKLALLIDRFEARMVSGDAYTNIKPAYDAYVAALKVFDAVVYGEMSANDAGLSTACSDLETALNNMSLWSENAGTVSVKLANYEASSDYYNKVLYASETTNFTSEGSCGYLRYKSYLPAVVVLYYDGISATGTPKFPAGGEIYRSASNRSATIETAYVSSSNSSNSTNTSDTYFGYTGRWVGYSSTWDNGVPWSSYGSTEYFDGVYTTSTSNSLNVNYNGSRYYLNKMEYKGTGSYNNNNTIYFKVRNNYRGAWNSIDNSCARYVVDYSGAIAAVNAKKSLLASVVNCKDGGAAFFLTKFDAATIDIIDYMSSATDSNAGTKANDLNSALATAATNLNGASAPTADTGYDSYQVLRDTMDMTGRPIAEDYDIALRTAYTGATSTRDYSDETYDPFKADYQNATGAFRDVLTNGYTGSYNSKAVGTIATDLETEFLALDLAVEGNAPTIGGNALLGKEDTITLTNNEANTDDGKVYYKITYSNGNEVTGDIALANGASDSSIAPFNLAQAEGADTATVRAWVKVGGTNISAHTTFTLYKAPTGAPTVLQKTETITLSSQNGANAGTIKYNYDNSGNWITYSAPFAPFADSGAASRTIYVKEEGTGVESAVGTITVVRAASLAAYADPTPELGADYYNGDSTIYLATGDTYDAGTVKYQIQKASDSDFGSAQTYDTTNGFSAASYDNEAFIIIKAYAEGNEENATVTTLYNEELYNPLAYQESFNDVTVTNSSAADVLESGNGYNMTSSSGNSISVVKGAGTKSASGTEAHSWRNNVLKISANGTAPGPVVSLTQNPLNQAINAAAVRKNGVTISFWRHLEDTSGNTVSLPSSGDPTGYPWRNAIAFQKTGDNTAYYIIEVNGVNSRRVDGSNYLDVVPQNQDNTQHEEGNNNGEWEHVAITINPNSGIKVYTNGVEHEYKYANGTGTFSDGNNAAAAAEILAFLSDGTTEMTLDNGVMYEGNEYNLFLDDIRLYTKPLTQVEINNMYVDDYTDTVSTSTSTSHDPTSVTVYTLTNNKKVGIEYIEKNNIPDSQIASIDYYSFGTGMTIYHATDATQTKWEVIGDSEGRCGYQNEDLFGDNYTVALDAVRQDLGVNAETGAGYLVWAPHVMYNLERDCWVYYASMSSWGAVRSRTFMATSSNPISGYTYQGIIYRSNSVHPNAIDFCAYYDKDYNNLYFVIGSWGQTHSSGQFDAIYGDQLNADGTYSHAGTADYLETNGTPIARGYTADLESDFNDGNYGESQGSGEGAWVTYIDGYYYLFVSYGQNEGSYTERVWRSTDPLGRTQESSDGYTGFVSYEGNRTWSAINDSAATDFVRGNQLIAPFDMSMYDTVMRSTGHSSLYKVKTLNNEWVWVNAIHGRPYASETHNWVAVPDNALAKRQSGGVTGNVCMNNMVALNEDGWMVIFPNQYNGTDSYSSKLTAKDIEGVYNADDMRKVVNSKWGTEYKYTVLADKVHKDQGVALGYKDGIQFTSRFKLTYDSEKKIQYITMYTSSDVDPDTATASQIRYKGVVATHIGKDKYGNTKLIPMFGMINTYQGDDNPHALYKGELAWAYRSGDVPNANEVVSKVDAVALDGVIYTHASDAQEAAVAANHGVTAAKVAKASYALYGQEIADNFSYGADTSKGERYTTLTVAWPMKIDVNNPSAVYNYSDEEHTRDGGCTGSEIFAVPLNKNNGVFEPLLASGYTDIKQHKYDDTNQYWYDKSTGNVVSDAQIAAMTAEQRKNVVRYYGFTGYVSDYFKYNSDKGKYTEDGVELIITYIATADSDETDSATGEPLYRAGQEQQEFEFAYVMPNPAWAHTMAGVSNNNTDLGNDRNSSYGTFNRFKDSWGEVSPIYSSMLWYPFETYSGKVDNQSNYGSGVSGYLSDFEGTTFGDNDLDTISEIDNLFVFTDANEGVNSGSFSCWYHNSDAPNAYTVSPDVVDCNYYVDYSNEQLYDIGGGSGLITTSNGRPTGYTFKMITNNFLWNKISASSLFDLTSYQMNNTGLNVTYSSSYDNEVSDVPSIYAPNIGKTYTAPSNLINVSTIINKNYKSDFNKAGIQQTNLPMYGTCNTILGINSGQTLWFDDAMLYHTDTRSSNSFIDWSYRNKVLWFFSDKTIANMSALKGDTVNNRKRLDNSSIGSTTNTKIWNYFNYAPAQAYKTLDNGKGSTHSWHGEATFTGKDSVIPNKRDIHYYDGYWYISSGRYYWTADEATASQYSSYGPLEVTAENYANYILEMGSYHKVTDVGADGGRFLGKENYHYYNIGVHTCDKGAMRQFAEEMMNKDIHEDPETGEIIIEGTVLDNARYSYASYKDYIDAIAKCMWFVEDPTKTTFGDIKDEERYADVYEDAKQMYIDSELGGDASRFDEEVFDATEYTTAYNAADGKAYYLNDNNHVGTTIFYDGSTTKTDYVQAALVQDVLKAYEDLYDVNNYVAVEDEFKKTETFFNNAVAADSEYYDETGEHLYSTDSMNDFYKALNAIRENAVNYYVYNDENYGPHKDTYNPETGTWNVDAQYEAKDKDGNPILDENNNPIVYDIIDTPSDISEAFWRTTELSGADYENLKDYMKELRGSLAEPVDLTPLTDQMDTAVVPVLNNGKLVINKNADGMMTGYQTETAQTLEGEEAPLSKKAMNEKGIFDEADGETYQKYSYNSWEALEDALHNGSAADYENYVANLEIPRAEETANREASAAEMVEEDGATEIVSEVGTHNANKYATLGERQLNGILNLPTTGTNPDTGEAYEVYGYKILLDASDANSPYFSRDQLAVNAKAEELAPLYLKQVDDKDNYDAYNDAYAMISAVDTDRYYDASDITAELAKRNPEVYVDADDAADKYNARMSADKTHLGEGGWTDELRVLSKYSDGEGVVHETDPYTAALLTSVEEKEADKDANVKKFHARLTVSKLDGSGNAASGFPQTLDQDKYYGETFDFDVPGLTETTTTDPDTGVSTTTLDQTVTYSITKKDGIYSDFATAEATGSLKWTYKGTTVSRIADSNVEIAASIVEDRTSTNDLRIKFYNVYDRVVQTSYVTAQPTNTEGDPVVYNGEDVLFTAETVPFYTFTGYDITEVKDANENIIGYDYKAKYDAGELITITYTNSATYTKGTRRAAVDNHVVLDASSYAFEADTEFWAWAVKVGNKYSVASYSKAYDFYAVTNTEIALITKNVVTNNYQVDGTDLTADMISGNIGIFAENTGTTNYPYGADRYLKEKLDQKLPFITLLTSTLTLKNGKYEALTYGFVTEGAKDKLNNVALAATIVKDGNTLTPSIKINNILDSGQFTVTFKVNAEAAPTVTGKGVIDYQFTYTYDGTDYMINAKDTTIEKNFA